jgi:uncharacterized protein YjbI with pentapeptide repeats
MTVRDWLQLLIVPVALVVIGFVFTTQQDVRQQAIEARQRAQEAESQAQYSALQAYLDQMSQLMLEEHLRSSEVDSEVRALARARTQTVLGQLDSDRKASVVQFLYEASLIKGEDPVLNLSGVSLRGGLRGANLSQLDLSHANLSGAVLRGADLHGTNLSDAILRGAELNNVDLRDATMSDANMSGAFLRYADLREAQLFDTNLSGADLPEADLGYARLDGAKGVTEEQLKEAKTLKGATMPNGQKYEN